MALESAPYINSLNINNPSNTEDFVSSGDDHLRLIKSSVKNSFPRITGPVSASQDDLSNCEYLVEMAGVANNIVVYPTTAWTEYKAGKGCYVKISVTNSSGPTWMSVSGLGGIVVTDQAGYHINPGVLLAGYIYHFIFNGTSFQLQEFNGYLSGRTLAFLHSGPNDVTINNGGTGTMYIGTNGHWNQQLNSDGSTSIHGTLYCNAIGAGHATASFNTVNASTVNASGDISNQYGVLPFPSGTRLPFAQASAPAGWTQDTSTNANNRMLRVVSVVGGTTGLNGTGGYGYGGTHSPILMNVVPSHTHSININTGDDTPDHSHDVYANYQTALNHAFPGWDGDGNGANGATLTTGGASSRHHHNVSGTSAANTSSSNWTPNYINMIICTKN